MSANNDINNPNPLASSKEGAEVNLKVCGMKYPENIADIAMLQPDYLGFIFYEKSSRFFNDTIPKLPSTIKKVGVFVNASLEEIVKKVEKYGLDFIQLHGEESPEFCLKLRRHYELANNQDRESRDDVISTKEDRNPHDALNYNEEISAFAGIVKAFPIKNHFNFDLLKPYESVCDYFLFDTKGKLPGGNGYSFNWEILRDYPSTKPYFLSGGIGLEEVDQLVEFLDRPESQYCHAIDVNSKFEIEPGLKDTEKLILFKNKLISITRP